MNIEEDHEVMALRELIRFTTFEPARVKLSSPTLVEESVLDTGY